MLGISNIQNNFSEKGLKTHIFPFENLLKSCNDQKWATDIKIAISAEYNWKSRNKPHFYNQLILAKFLRQFNGENSLLVSPTRGLSIDFSPQRTSS